jgi:hypothetical protein
MIKDRIKDLRRVKASTLKPHPLNYRTHPERQKTLLGQLLLEIGYADALLARETKEGLELLDGHLRAKTTPNALVPVLVVDLTDDEAKKLLLTLDPLAGLAETDGATFAKLLGGVKLNGELDLWLKERSEQIGLFDVGTTGHVDLPTGDKEPFQALTFTLSDRQASLVRQALAKAQALGCDAPDNKNSNGNALAAIAEAYLEIG